MKIETRFNPGDEIFYIVKESVSNQKWVLLLEGIKLKIKMVCFYAIEDNKAVYYICTGYPELYERNCFATKEEAEAECSRRNGE